MKGRLDTSRGMETLMAEALSKIKPKNLQGQPSRQREENENDQIPRAILQPKR
jgi:hypothetical protein